MVPPPSPYTLEALNPDGFLALRSCASPPSPDGAEDFLCEYANPAAEALWKETLTGRRLFATRPELSLAGRAWGQVLATGESHTSVLRTRCGEVALQVRARAVRVEPGLLAVWLSDVTESERFMRETADFEERMLDFVECMPDPFLALDAQGRLSYVNGAAERMLGKRRQELMGRPLAHAYEESAGSGLIDQVRRVMVTGQPVDFEERFHARDFQVAALPRDRGVLVYLRDITPPATAPGALFQVLSQGSTDAIYTKDLEGRYTRINEAGARHMGLTPESVLGHTDAELWPEAAARSTLEHDREVLDYRRTLTYEDVEAGPRPRVWRSTKGVLRDETGDVAGLFGISRDVTDVRRARDALAAVSMTPWDLRLPEQRLYWERSAAAYFALDMLPAEESLEAFLARVHAEDRSAVAEALSLDALTSAAGVSLHYRVRLGTGAQRRHLLRARPLRVASGWRVLGLLEDVTGPRREDEPRPRQERGHA